MATSIIPLSSATAEDQTDPFAGGRYRLLSRLSSSGTGELCIVEHRALGKQFLAKLLHPSLAQDPQAVERLRLEAQALGRLRHPNVVGIVGFEYTSASVPYLVMDLVRGPSLEQELAARGIITLEEALEWVGELLDALEAAHADGLVHRDIQPRNLVLHGQAGGGRVLKVVNFGTARVIANAPEGAPRPLAFPTAEGTLVGTPWFASPEAVRGQLIDARSDLYQVGLVLRWLLEGSDANAEIPDSTVRAVVTRPGSGAMHAEIQAVVRRALAEDPRDRFQCAADFRDALAEAARAGRYSLSESWALAPEPYGDAAQIASSRWPESLRPIVLMIVLFVLSAAATMAFGLLLLRWW